MALNRKIKTLEEFIVELRKLRNFGKKIVHCHGVFDLVHIGHIRHFSIARELGDVLVVTITPDQYVNKGPGRPVFTEALRAEFIAALEPVDYVIINQWPTAVEIIKAIKPDIYVKGQDYADSEKDETGGICREREEVESAGGKIHFTGDITFSSSSLLNEYFDIYPREAQEFLAGFRKKYSAEKVVEMLKSLKSMKVLIIGETILDKYVFMAPMMSKPPKGNHIAARTIGEETHAGGILACANHLANFCGSVDLITAVGRDGNDEFVRAHLKSNINLRLFHHDTAPTIVKRRFIETSYKSKLFEEYILDDRPSPELNEKILGYLYNISRDLVYDLILVLDYGHGLITPKQIDFLCNQRLDFLAVNAQTNTANMGFNLITKYPRANYFCLDDRELRLAFHDNYSQSEKIIKHLAERTSCCKVYMPRAVAVTLGHFGAMTFDAKKNELYQAPILSQKIVDTTGAGDAFFALTAPCVAKGFPMDLVAFVGNAAGALAVGYLGNQISIEATPFFKFITALLK